MCTHFRSTRDLFLWHQPRGRLWGHTRRHAASSAAAPVSRRKKPLFFFFFAALVIIRLCQDGFRARKVVPQNCDELLLQLQRRRTTTNGCKLIPVMIFRTGMIRGISRDGIESARFCCAEESLPTSREGGRFR